MHAYEITELRVDFGSGAGEVWLHATSTPGTGSVDLGTSNGRLYALGQSEAHVDLVHGTAGVDNLLNISVRNVRHAVATGTTVRVTGDDQKNDLAGYGCDVADGRGGNDRCVVEVARRCER